MLVLFLELVESLYKHGHKVVVCDFLAELLLVVFFNQQTAGRVESVHRIQQEQPRFFYGSPTFAHFDVLLNQHVEHLLVSKRRLEEVDRLEFRVSILEANVAVFISRLLI